MSSRHITQQLQRTLHGLLPAYTPSSLPKALLELATALLLQSQSRAAQLKPEEEPARYTVICEIACHRLKTRLNLPNIESRPPCPPRTYKKLYQFLDRTLAVPIPQNDASDKKKPQAGKAATPAEGRLLSPSTPRSGSRKRPLPLDDTHAHPIQLLTPSLTPSTTPRKRLRFGEEVEGNIVTLASLSTSLQASRRNGRSAEGGIAQGKSGVPKPDSETDDTMEEDEYDDVALVNSNSVEREEVGSLMESRFDWLSNQRKAEYAQWRSAVLRRIDVVERAQQRAGAVD